MSHFHTFIAFVALGASLLLLVSAQSRGLAAIAAIVSGIEVLIALKVVHLSIAPISLIRSPVALLLGGALLVATGMLYLRSSTKMAISASTIAGLIGAIQVLHALGIGRI